MNRDINDDALATHKQVGVLADICTQLVKTTVCFSLQSENDSSSRSRLLFFGKSGSHQLLLSSTATPTVFETRPTGR